MSRSTTTNVSRRSVLKGAAVAVAGAGVAARPADAQAPGGGSSGLPTPPLRVKRRLQLVDGQHEQRFLLQDSKPPVLLLGKTYPAEARQGPADASYMLFNDENQSEKGGIIAGSEGAQISFDYVQAQGITLGTGWSGALGAASLSMSEMPDPSIPVEELTPADVPTRVVLGTSNAGDGALLYLFDHQERPRIVIEVDGNDDPHIRILDAQGAVVASLPEEAPAAATARHANGARALLDRVRASARKLR